MSELFEIFFSPGKAFDQVRERSLFLPAMVVTALLGAAYFAVLANFVGMENMARKQIEASSRTASLTPEQKETAIRSAGSPVRQGLGYGFAVLGTVLSLLVIAGLSFGGVSAAGGKVKFAQVLGATSYAAVPFSLLNVVMATAVILATPDRDSLDYTNLIATNVGAFLDKETTGKAIFSMAGSVDLISFAHIAFLSYGLSKVSRLSFSACAAIVIAMWIVYVLCKAGFALLF